LVACCIRIPSVKKPTHIHIMYRPNRFTPLMPAAVQPKRSLTNKNTAVRSSIKATNPPVEDDQAFQTAEQRLAHLRASTAMYTTQSEAYLVVNLVSYARERARSQASNDRRTYMKARGYPVSELESDALVHKLAGEKRIRFRRHGRNPNVWFATSLRPSAMQQQKPRARPWYGMW
jgi:hypothetical protein